VKICPKNEYFGGNDALAAFKILLRQNMPENILWGSNGSAW
jgi:hypothetical protein